MNIVLLETSGNQAFIFATNKLRENIGASELTCRAGTEITLAAVTAAGGPSGLWSENPSTLRSRIGDPSLNPPVADGAQVEVITATSGKALLLVRDEPVGKAVVAHATDLALEKAPGLDLCGVVSTAFDWNASRVHAQVAAAHQELARLRGLRPDPQLRFLTLPILARCASSGRPASEVTSEGTEDRDLSHVSLRKRRTANSWTARIQHILQGTGQQVPHNLQEFEQVVEDMQWLSVVHADGNGLGTVFLNFDSHAGINVGGAEANARYVAKLRQFSLALEEATEEAFKAALRCLPPIKQKQKGKEREWLPVVPLVLGGDDLTVLCEGRSALLFTQAYLREFEAATADRARRHGIIPEIASGGLSACAGVAITKPHFPFYSAYELAEQLLRSAKVVKHKAPGCSAFDFHILFDSTFTDLDDIRARLTPPELAARLTGKPYVVTRADATWVGEHHIDRLAERIRAIRCRDPNDPQRRRLPNSQLHDLREGLFGGKGEADARLALIYHRYADEGLSSLVEVGGKAPSLFRTGSDGVQETRLLDAIEAAEFWPGDEDDNG